MKRRKPGPALNPAFKGKGERFISIQVRENLGCTLSPEKGEQNKAAQTLFCCVSPFRSAPAQAAGSNSIVGTTVKNPSRMPEHLLADEKHTRFNGEKAYIATTVAQECILGVGFSDTAGTEDLTKSYGHFKEEALNLNPDYQPKTVNTDGWEHTRRAWKSLFPGITLILCFLHAFLNIRDRCKRDKDLHRSISERLWNIYHAKTKAQRELSSLLYTRSRHEGLRASPFEELNGFQYHSNWLKT